ncbi:MAG: hypothetical protein ACOCYB_05475 [Alkalispirochaeta sp.]
MVKLKAIFIIFNVLVAFSFLFVFFMPAFFLGWDYARVFWTSNWYLAAIFVIVLVVLNTYFISNRRLFSALEAEDWDAVISVMEHRVYHKHRYSTGNIRLLVNAYVVTSQSEKVQQLEDHLRDTRYAVVRRNALIFGIPHLLSNDGEEMARYYGEFLDTGRGEDRDWIRWNYAFACMLKKDLSEARTILEELCNRVKPGVISAVSAYLLSAYGDESPDAVALSDRTRSAIRTAMSRAEWNKKVEKARGDLHVLVLSKLLQDVEAWLYTDQSAGAAE